MTTMATDLPHAAAVLDFENRIAALPRDAQSAILARNFARHLVARGRSSTEAGRRAAWYYAARIERKSA